MMQAFRRLPTSLRTVFAGVTRRLVMRTVATARAPDSVWPNAYQQRASIGSCSRAPAALATSSPRPTSYVEPPGAEKRLSRRRYTADNTRGRVAHAKDLITAMKQADAEGARALFDSLKPRDKLDVVRLLHLRRTKRRRERREVVLPRYRSPLFERLYFFREEDVTEQSTLGRGPGGQATNRRMQTVILTHTPSGLIVKFSRFPSLWLNRRAARELLNVRLEEWLLGPDSELGRARARKERRRQRKAVQLERLATKGNVLVARDTQRREFHAVLTGAAPLPRRAAEQLGLEHRPQPLLVRDLFEGECLNWWPLLHHAFGQCEGKEVPLLLQYLFPVSAATDSQAAQYERSQVKHCGADAAAVSNVRCALRCFCELFGLRLVEAVDAEGTSRLVLTRDGLNWSELGRRMRDEGGRRIDPHVLAAWCHVHASLQGLGLAAEAQSVRVFFARERKREAGQQTADRSSWAAEACRALVEPGRRRMLRNVVAATTFG